MTTEEIEEVRAKIMMCDHCKEPIMNRPFVVFHEDCEIERYRFGASK